MKKFIVTIYTNVVIENEQDSFQMEIEHDSYMSVANFVIKTIQENDFVKHPNLEHYYRSENITDFRIRELEENK